MAVLKPVTLYEAMKPIIIVSRIIGILPITFQPEVKNSRDSRVSKFSANILAIISLCYSFSLIITIVCLCYTIIFSKIKTIYSEIKHQFILTDVITMILMFLCTYVALIHCSLLKRNKWDEIMIRIQKLDNRLFKSISMHSYNKLLRNIILQLSAVICVSAVLITFDYFELLEVMNPILVYTRIALQFVRCFMDLQYINLNLIIRERFIMFNEQILRAFGFKSEKSINRCLIRSSKNIFEKDLNILRRFFAHIRQLLCGNPRKSNTFFTNNSKYNDSFMIKGRICMIRSKMSENNIQTIRIDHIEICSIQQLINDYYQTYMLLEFLNTGADLVLFLCILWIGFNILKFVIITGSCGSVINADKSTAIIVSKVLNFTECLQPKITKQLYKFSRQLLYSKVNFTANHFFHLDSAVLGGIVKAIIIYVVILLQSQNMYKK
ncbi:hypothetical protein L9F63_010234 [Diploptera punctata]|uniref:Gustatory receptor n=1 Tax=Diploptera punctata TaxID=6984 RepID=A0AAD8ERE9_DIPPU|nr:hypothetical protein L9F63_010234 [Diploptera punctata]